MRLMTLSLHGRQLKCHSWTTAVQVFKGQHPDGMGVGVGRGQQVFKGQHPGGWGVQQVFKGQHPGGWGVQQVFKGQHPDGMGWAGAASV